MPKTRSPSVLGSGRVLYLPTARIRPNPMQPRKHFDTGGLQELAGSIRQYGVLQPLTVRKAGGAYELVAGERRLRAARLAGLTEVPCLLADVDEEASGMLAWWKICSGAIWITSRKPRACKSSCSSTI